MEEVNSYLKDFPLVGENDVSRIDPFIGQPVYGAFSIVLACVFPMIWTFALRNTTKFNGLGWKVAAYG